MLTTDSRSRKTPHPTIAPEGGNEDFTFPQVEKSKHRGDAEEAEEGSLHWTTEGKNVTGQFFPLYVIPTSNHLTTGCYEMNTPS